MKICFLVTKVAAESCCFSQCTYSIISFGSKDKSSYAKKYKLTYNSKNQKNKILCASLAILMSKPIPLPPTTSLLFTSPMFSPPHFNVPITQTHVQTFAWLINYQHKQFKEASSTSFQRRGHFFVHLWWNVWVI